MKLLLTNDDGIDAPGLQALFDAAKELGDPWVIAPAGPQSGCSHTVTTHRGLRIEPRGDARFAVHGTPADCVRVGLHGIVTDAAWILSGINHGGNLGADVHYSGTVAAVREGTLHGWPGIAISNYRHQGHDFDWHGAARLIVPILRDLMAQPRDPGTFWNVNLPHLHSASHPEVVFCPVDPTPLPLEFRHEEDELHYSGNYFSRQRQQGCDVAVCFGGQISVSKIRLL